MERTEWLKRRRAGIGGSDVAAILGISPWKTALDVYHDKTGAAKDEPETENMRLGTALEQFVADRFTETFYVVDVGSLACLTETVILGKHAHGMIPPVYDNDTFTKQERLR